MAETLEVLADGEILEGWKTVRISRAFDRLAGSFALDLAEVSPDSPLERRLPRGARVEFHLDGELVLSGLVSKKTKKYDGSSNSITVAGHDLAADLVDCSADHVPGEWNGARLGTIASDLIAPFPLLEYKPALSVSGLGSAEKFELETGETVFSALDRLARMRGLLLLSDLKGGVYFGRPGATRAPVTLERGSNIEKGTLDEDDSGRFSVYTFHTQAPSAAHWDAGSGPGMSVRVTARDPGVSRFRPSVVVAEESADEPTLQRRADFEASVNAARSARVSYTLPDWTLDGYLWEPGALVPVFDPMLGIGTSGGSPRDLLVGAVEWNRSASGKGSTTSLELYLPGSFQSPPVKAPKNEGIELWDL